MKNFETRFFDGQSLKPIDVEVSLEETGLTIVSKHAVPSLTLHWPKENLSVILPAREDAPGKITEKNMPNAMWFFLG